MSLATRALDDLDFGSGKATRPGSRTTLSEADLGAPSEFGTPSRVIDLTELLRQQSARDWARSVVEPFRALAEGWDSYGAHAIDPGAATHAEHLLAYLVGVDGLALPQAAPSPDGGVSIEWHRPGVDFVISIGPHDEPPSAYFSRNGEGLEVDDIREPDGADVIGAALEAFTNR